MRKISNRASLSQHPDRTCSPFHPLSESSHLHSAKPLPKRKFSNRPLPSENSRLHCPLPGRLNRRQLQQRTVQHSCAPVSLEWRRTCKFLNHLKYLGIEKKLNN